jgi:hypothetical protein
LPGATTLCLNDGRFKVEAAWTTLAGLTGPGVAVEETADTGRFWFFSPNNLDRPEDKDDHSGTAVTRVQLRRPSGKVAAQDHRAQDPLKTTKRYE